MPEARHGSNYDVLCTCGRNQHQVQAIAPFFRELEFGSPRVGPCNFPAYPSHRCGHIVADRWGQQALQGLQWTLERSMA
eukprot:CAMPEP_0179280834 /NCGR_PEP_ID=MMETSP0797-20121207/36833_1 /TAXON_ID=47934 /ORGANISM="Dinophysis acuminata, Strain DAEP01" /LENGTH=78 /DNA_ID=CAMNT_0020989505 /DNA_START=105 /DNA_END=338 /DNA_ORIENTATION=+